MGRVNKSIEGVFTEIVGTNEQISSYDIFIGEEKVNNKILKSYLQQYKSSIIKYKTEFQKLAKLEEIIMQIRSREKMEDIKLSLVREYIYARCSFYRVGKTSKDIRIIVDNVGDWEDNMDNLLKNKTFMDKAKTKLINAMTKEIDNNIKIFNSIYTGK